MPLCSLSSLSLKVSIKPPVPVSQSSFPLVNSLSILHSQSQINSPSVYTNITQHQLKPICSLSSLSLKKSVLPLSKTFSPPYQKTYVINSKDDLKYESEMYYDDTLTRKKLKSSGDSKFLASKG